jgi:NagD protein
VLTSNPPYTPGDLAHRLKTIGLDIPPERMFTSAMATALLLKSQKAHGTALVVGESGLTEAIPRLGTSSPTTNPTMSCWARPRSTAWT